MTMKPAHEDLYGRELPLAKFAQSEADDPFARTPPPHHEPLFPAASTDLDADAAPVRQTPRNADPAPAMQEPASVPPLAAPAAAPSWIDPSPAADLTPVSPVPPVSPLPTRPARTYLPAQAADEPKPTPLRSPQSVVAGRYAVMHTLEANFNQRFAVVSDLMQHGAWPQTLEKLQALQIDYPRAYFLEPLIDEATLKAELMEQWAHKIKGRRFTVAQEWLLRRSLPFFALLILFSAGLIFYQSFVEPSRLVMAMARVNQDQIATATEFVQQGNFSEAVALYETVLMRDPDNVTAQQGLGEAKRLRGVAVAYDVAMQVAAAGNLRRAQSLLTTISANANAYRDVDTKLSQLNTQIAAETLFLDAEKTFSQRRWATAVARYEQVQQVSADYKQEVVKQRLNEAYYHAGRTLALHWPTESAGPDQARAYLRKAQSAGIQRDETGRLLASLDLYFKGLRALENQNLGQALNAWQGLLDEQPELLGGYVAEQLYRAYLVLASEVGPSDPDYARQLYEAAARLPVQDAGEARRQLSLVGVAAPAPTATPTPIPPAPVVVAPPVAPVAPAPAEPTPTPTPANSYGGWIAFRSQRNGSEGVFIMRADGSEQQPAPDEIRTQLSALYQAQQISADGSRQAFVQSAPGRSDANIFITSGNGDTRMLTDFLQDEYDPVWSPDGQSLALVANHTGNDEIWVIQAGGNDPRQLTFNEWEWDKHPTWSPDGSRIAFFSNRTGQRQIWMMGRDGANVRNLSSNVYDDWDPVWLR
jgi:TolB protein